MTPQEKARELIDKYRKFVYNYVPHQSIEQNEFNTIRDAKQCALIAVNEIINIVPSVYLTDDEEIHSGHYQYWQQVKSEIEKL